MKHVDEYRDPQLCRQLVEQIRETVTRRRTIMEVCGGQTHGLLSHGIDQELRDVVELVHGPGCPVCVTSERDIDLAVELSRQPDVIMTSFGDMLRVPGSRESLLQARTSGGDIRMVYSPVDAVRMAVENPDRTVVFFAVGFETTMPATAVAIQQAAALGLENFCLIVSHVRVLPAMESVARDPHCRVEGFLGAGHVCAVDGFADYEAFAERWGGPVIITGFEPVDLLSGILECVQQIESGGHAVVNRYSRTADRAGNPHARSLVSDVYRICDRDWRGLGSILDGGVCLREEFQRFDATRRFERIAQRMPGQLSGGCDRCRGGDVLSGRIRPTECEFFGKECTPESPLGAPMVSSEGACAAYFRYARTQPL